MIAKSRALTGAALWSVLAVAAVATQGCSGLSQKLGLDSQPPDEFKVVAKAPLTVPPDYSLRPPAPGQPRPMELQPESSARLALVGQQEATQRSQGESLLVARAGGPKADPLIRYVVDDEFGGLAHKDKSFADWVIFWKPGKPAMSPSADATTPTPIDAATEAQRIATLTGNKTVIIARSPPGNKIKLPGL